ncbi:hypothetical protein ABBQ38_014061 [Trebouxia sp. C0009 RCD-2024]
MAVARRSKWHCGAGRSRRLSCSVGCCGAAWEAKGTSLMDEVFINQEADPYVVEADGTLDVAALQLQPATVVINGKKGLVDVQTSKTKRTVAELQEKVLRDATAGSMANPLHISGASLAGGSQSAVDKTARKIAALEQLVGSQPPAFGDLQAFLYEEPTVKLPVANAKYCSLIADNEALMSKIEPESKSEAAALARVVTVALETEYEPVADELVLAGFVDALLWNVWRCMSKYDQGYNPGMSRKRNCGDDSATLKGQET